MYACYVAIVTSYGMKKDGLKKLVKGKLLKNWEREINLFVDDRLSEPHMPFY